MTFQLDESSNDERFERACKSAGKADLWRYPKAFKGKPDPEILPHFMAQANTFLTVDHHIAEDHTKYIPDFNPGLVMIHYSAENPRTMTSKGMQKIIQQFKGNFATWHQHSFANSVIKLNEKEVRIWHVEGGALIEDAYLPFARSDWQTVMANILSKNAARKLLV